MPNCCRRNGATPAALAGDLGRLLYAPRVAPAPPALSSDPLPRLRDAADALRTAVALHGDEACAALDAAIESKVLNGTTYKKGLPAELMCALARWCALGDASASVHDRIDRLTPQTLADKTNKPKSGSPLKTPTSPLFDAVAALRRHREGARVVAGRAAPRAGAPGTRGGSAQAGRAQAIAP